MLHSGTPHAFPQSYRYALPPVCPPHSNPTLTSPAPSPQAGKEARKDLQTKLADMLHNDESRDVIIASVKELTSKLQLADAEVIAIVSTGVGKVSPF